MGFYKAQGKSWITISSNVFSVLFITSTISAICFNKSRFWVTLNFIAENVRKERRRRCISQAELAERAEISVDTVKSIENGRRTMSLDTYLRIVKALDVPPFDLMDWGLSDNYIEGFIFIINKRSSQEIEFVLYIAEQPLKGKDMREERSSDRQWEEYSR